jgi:hypothetical protein
MTDVAPLFLLTTHRSGGTLLARIYNVHPNIVVWGEHAGLLNHFAAIADIMRLHGGMSTPVADRKIDQFLQNKSINAAFSPWINPVDPPAFAHWCRTFIVNSFSTGLRPGQRWGVKEIRYHTVETVGFILSLFPDARFVILRRDLLQQCISNIMAEWSLIHLGLMHAGETEADAAAVIEDCAYALVAIDHGLGRIAKKFSAQTLVINYEDLLGGPPAFIENLYKFAGLAVTPDLLAAAARMRAVRTGATKKAASLGFITVPLIEELAPRGIAEAYRSIDRDGVDLSRLRRKQGQGRYSFLVGDTEMRNSRFSTLF